MLAQLDLLESSALVGVKKKTKNMLISDGVCHGCLQSHRGTTWPHQRLHDPFVHVYAQREPQRSTGH